MQIPATLGALLSAASLVAQNVVYHDDASPLSGAGNAFPFGVETVRLQQLIPNAVLGTSPCVIQDLYVDPLISNSQGLHVSQVFYGDIEVRMGATQLSVLTTDWATNSPTPTTVYRGPLLVRFEKNRWCALGLPRSFAWNPASAADNLVVEFIVWDVADTGAVIPNPSGYFLDVRRSVGGSIQRAYRLGWTVAQQPTAIGVDGSGIKLGFLIDDGNFVVHDGECVGSSGAAPRIGAVAGSLPSAGATFDVTIAGGQAGALAALVLGLERESYLGVSLPYDLQPLGAPGCRMWHGWEAFSSGVVLDAAGSGVTTLLFPPMVPQQARLYGTWLCLDPAANSLGVVPSGFLGMTL
ncbi:MAG: hypothetical protein H6835_10185 [Planctomycetes bacterium]|nr:hypothetical protein [Planctomycetota bacterium]